MALGATVKGYLGLCRISNLPSVWTNVLCALVLAAGRFSWGAYLPPALSLSCFYLAGMCLNDLRDAELDRIHRPSRPIPAGSVSPEGAWLLTGVLFAGGLAGSFLGAHREGGYAALLLMAVIVWYDFSHKQNPFSVLLMASCRFLVFVVTALATTGMLATIILLAAGIQFFYVVGVSLVARYENHRSTPFSFPVIPLLLAGIALLDGVILAVAVQPLWLLAGMGGAVLLYAGQKAVRGD